jgi:hypothetical protein
MAATLNSTGILFSDSTGFNTAGSANGALNGYQKLPSGIIIQWGYVSSSGGNVTFPLAFPTGCWVIVAGNANSQGADVDNAFAYPIGNLKTQFYCATKGVGGNGNISGYSIYWIAVGI